MKKPSEIIKEKAKEYMPEDIFMGPSIWEMAVMEYLDERFEEMQKIIKQSQK